MRPQEKVQAEQRAREFVDEVIEINRKYGMGTNVPEDVYEHAVQGSVEAVKGLIERHR